MPFDVTFVSFLDVVLCVCRVYGIQKVDEYEFPFFASSAALPCLRLPYAFFVPPEHVPQEGVSGCFSVVCDSRSCLQGGEHGTLKLISKGRSLGDRERFQKHPLTLRLRSHWSFLSAFLRKLAGIAVWESKDSGDHSHLLARIYDKVVRRCRMHWKASCHSRCKRREIVRENEMIKTLGTFRYLAHTIKHLQNVLIHARFLKHCETRG